jgi:hypothetical protein
MLLGQQAHTLQLQLMTCWELNPDVTTPTTPGQVTRTLGLMRTYMHMLPALHVDGDHGMPTVWNKAYRCPAMVLGLLQHRLNKPSIADCAPHHYCWSVEWFRLHA